ncbi:MAG: MFS transporter [Pseudomonadota bacterium]
MANTGKQSWRLNDALIVLYFCISLGLNNGFILGGLTAFDQGFLERLDITVAQLKLRDSITLATVGVFAFVTGILVDKLGALRVLILGHALLSASFLILSYAQSIETIYAAQALLGICQLCSGYLVCVIAVSRLLSTGVGLAIGFMMASTSLANGLLPGINTTLIGAVGAQATLQLTALCGLLLILGAVLVMGRKSKVRQDHSDAALQGGPTLGEAVRRADFWAVIILACTSFFVFLGLVTNLPLYAAAPPLNDIGLSSRFFVALFVVSLIAQSVAGWVADRYSLRPIHMAGLLIMLAASIGLALSQTGDSAFVWLLAMGLGWGFNYVFVQISIPARFGGAHLGKIFGIIVVAEALAGAAGPVIFGRSLDLNGNYQSILMISAGLLAMSTAAAALLHRPIQPSLAPAV